MLSHLAASGDGHNNPYPMRFLGVDQELTMAALPRAVLAVLSHGENHGYAIAEVYDGTASLASRVERCTRF
ncbi:hypothetical protein ACW0JT_14515 [Arthrobacter sp. SA17]